MTRFAFVTVLLTTMVPACGDDDGSGGTNDASVDGGTMDGATADASTTVDGGTPPQNADSPLGTNLTGISDWSREWAFVDAFKMSRHWISGNSSDWDDGRAIDTDADGWVGSLLPDQIVRTLLFWGDDEYFPAGRYVVLYEGEGTIEYWSGATRDDSASSPGRDVLDVDPAQGGIGVNITDINTADPLRNIRVIMPGGVCTDDPFRFCDESTPCAAGTCESFEDNHTTQIFHPLFLDRIKTYRLFRFMDWMDTNNSLQQAWADRPRVADARWSTHGVPVEVMVDLANRLSADAWFTLPHLADDDYVQRFATTVRDQLRPELRAYVEHSNEVWNGIFSQSDYARQQGLAASLSTNDYEAQLRYHSQRSVEMFQIWETVFGGTGRLVRVMGSQAANSWVSEQVLGWGDAAAHTDALAIAPYFGGYLGGPGEETRVAAMTVDELLLELETTALPTAETWITDSAAVAQTYSVDLISYEGGQHLAGHGGVENNDTINALFDEANRHAQMGTLYTTYLEAWRTHGGALFVHFVNCSGYSKWGRWGALEYLIQPRSEAPKFDALMTFIEDTSPWW